MSIPDIVEDLLQSSRTVFQKTKRHGWGSSTVTGSVDPTVDHGWTGLVRVEIEVEGGGASAAHITDRQDGMNEQGAVDWVRKRAQKRAR